MSQAVLADCSFQTLPTTSDHTPGDTEEEGLWKYYGNVQTEAELSGFKTWWFMDTKI